jgi:signal transduction histidine kinase/CheY-like chemotaxis protein
MDKSSSWTIYLARLAFFTLVYLAAAKISLLIQGDHDGITPIWPPAGIALFVFHRYGLRMWPVVALGVGLLDWQIGVPSLSAAMITVGNISEAWLGCFLLRRFDIRIGQRFQDAVKFLLLPTLLAPLSAATIGTLGLILGGVGSWEDIPVMWFMWWVGDACGILLFMPLFHAWWRHPKKWSTGKRLVEWLIVITFTLFIGWHTFHDKQLAELHGAGNLQFLVMPFLLWAAIRLGLRGATLVSLIGCGWVLWGAANNTGPFEMDNKVVMGLFESSFILVITLTGLIVQALFREHSLNMDKLRNAHHQLEERVKERTADLEYSNDRLRQEIEAKTLTESALHKSERQLYKAKQAAEQANDSKTRFLAAASHDLRQPLQAITSSTELLTVKNRNPELAGSIKQLRKATSAMRELLEKLLDVSEIDAGRLSTKLIAFPINRLLGELQGQFQQIALEKGIDLKRVPCSVLVHSDPALMRIILQNLISNAIKYTRRGRVTIGCRRRGGLLRICIYDTGIGITEDEQEVIFEEFYQLDNPARDRKQGTGFGLAIVQRVSDLLKHPLHVRSVPGKGSCFAVDVPMSERRESVLAGKPDTTLFEGAATATRALLLIDDDEIVLDANRMLLDMLGYHVIAVTGAEAAINSIASGLQQPEIIISDYRLPGTCKGTELISELRTRADRQIPAIILTGDITLSDDRDLWPDKCVLVQKPVSADKLQQVIKQLLEESTG